MQLAVDQEACLSSLKDDKIGCDRCLRNIDIAEAGDYFKVGFFEIKAVKNLKTKTTHKCSGFIDNGEQQ